MKGSSSDVQSRRDRIDDGRRLIEQTALAAAAQFSRTDPRRTAVGQQVDYIRSVATNAPTG